MHRYVKIEEVQAEFQVDLTFIETLANEDVIHLKHTAENDVVISAPDIERLRVALLLTRELEVNLAGVEVIVHMRDAMLEMQRQFEDVLEAVVAEARRRNST